MPATHSEKVGSPAKKVDFTFWQIVPSADKPLTGQGDGIGRKKSIHQKGFIFK